MIKNLEKIKNKEAGFTIVEVIIASFVFSLIAVGVSLIFISILQTERRAFAAQKIEENGQFVLEMMARDIRVSKIEGQDDPTCSLTSLSVIHPTKGTIQYFLDAGTGIVKKTEPSPGGTTVEISSSAVNFTRLNFCVRGSGTNDQKQAVVTVISSIRNRTGKEILQFNIQTAVSSRSVETELLN
ncbi:MAG: Type IV pilus assembly protein PilW [Parcubacteria group bacterium GW2011_GWA1_48_11b]|nr:MAG: Type IV pilus assembly protein PilW [Parcubacteria group bacterium GW2011_GWA1_48_11b]